MYLFGENMKKRKAKNFPVLILAGGGLLLIVAAVMLGMQNGTRQATPSEPVVSSGHEEETYPEIERVSLEDAKAALDAGTAVFVDVRGVDAYNLSHIPGSLSIPLAELESRLGELDPNQWIITYCT
jgi:3-mercaptopyruvate sulfurtransferase SseA